MPWVGLHDVVLGLLVLWRPCRALWLWLAIWCTWTALLRPLVGMSGFEFLERAGNYGVPLALFVAASLPTASVASAASSGWRGWFSPVAPEIPGEHRAAVVTVLRATVFLLLLGHGGLALGEKPLLVEHYAWLGFTRPELVCFWSGVFEISLAIALFARPLAPLLALALVWKLATELLFPLSGDWIFEFIERGGSYGAPLALLLLTRFSKPEASP